MEFPAWEQLISQYLVKDLNIHIDTGEAELLVHLSPEEAAQVAKEIMVVLQPEIEGIITAAETAGRQKQTREEWLRPMITPQSGDDEDPRHPRG